MVPGKTGVTDQAGAAGRDAAPAAPQAAAPAQAETGKTLRALRDETSSTVKKKHVHTDLAQKHIPTDLAQVIKDVVPDPDSSGTGTLSRLERRIQVMERAFTDIVERHEKSLRDRADTLSTVEEGMSVLGRRLQQAEEYHASALAEIKTAIAETSMRLNLLEMTSECVKQAVDPKGPVTVPIPENRVEDPGDINVLRDDEDPTPRGDETYIEAARRAALASQARQEEENKQRARKSKGRRARFFIFGCMAPAVIGAVALFVLNRNTVTAETSALPEAASSVRSQPQSQPSLADAFPQLEPVAERGVPNLAENAESFDTLEALASAGDPKAARDVGLRYLTGNGVTVDPEEAASWLLRASYEGEPTAQYWLATLYARGQGVPSDKYQANHWYEEAAKAGNRRAMHSFGLANLEGWGRDKNAEEAAEWFAKAAGLGFVDSQFNLGVLYERGEGVKRSVTEAYKWYAIAAAQGDRQAAERLAVLAKAMEPSELALARSAAIAFKPAPLDTNANIAVTSVFAAGD